jgi:hypothetical protein
MNQLFSILLFLGLTSPLLCQKRPVEESEIHRIDLKLEKFRKQHQTGVLLSFIGAGIVLVPMLATGELIMGTVIAGSLLSTAGLIISIDSYKHLRYDDASDNWNDNRPSQTIKKDRSIKQPIRKE